MERLAVTSSLRDAREFEARIRDNRNIMEQGHFEASNLWVSDWYDEGDEDAKEEADELREDITNILAGLEIDGIEFEGGEDY